MEHTPHVGRLDKGDVGLDCLRMTQIRALERLLQLVLVVGRDLGNVGPARQGQRQCLVAAADQDLVGDIVRGVLHALLIQVGEQ